VLLSAINGDINAALLGPTSASTMPDDFLFAAVGEQQNGMPLNVVSGLTRLCLDPWEEAAEKLTPIIDRLPLDRPQPSDNLAISRLLVELLPEYGRAASQARSSLMQRARNIFRRWSCSPALVLGRQCSSACYDLSPATPATPFSLV
jgi:hypothetical protein